jgi:hypothetical protein
MTEHLASADPDGRPLLPVMGHDLPRRFRPQTREFRPQSRESRAQPHEFRFPSREIRPPSPQPCGYLPSRERHHP